MLQTENGPISVEKQVYVNIAGLFDGGRALILDSTLAVVSLGRRCVHEGLSFRKDACGQPDFRDPAGRSVPIVVERDIPYVAASPHVACPAEEAAPVDPEPDVLHGPPDDAAPEAVVGADAADEVAPIDGDEPEESRAAKLRAQAKSITRLLCRR